MPHILEDRVLESTTSTGTGAITLAGAVTGFRRFNAVCAVGDTVPYFIEAVDSVGLPTGDYEYGVGTYSAADTLTRTTVLGSSNAGAAVNFTAGSKNVGIGLNKSELVNFQARHGATGAHVQTVFHTDAGGVHSSTAMSTTTSSPAVITPQSTNSKIKVSVSFYGYSGASAGNARFMNARIYDGATPVGLQASIGNITSADGQAAGAYVLEAVVDNSSLTARSFTLATQNNGAVTSPCGAVNQVWTMTEVQD